jgi:RNA recognition motif-containing protein
MGKTVYIGNVGQEITDERLRELFAAHGEVLEIRVVTDHYTGRPRGFAFVDMATEEAAKTAISELNEQTVAGRQLTVAEARPRKQRAYDVYAYSDHRS